MADKQGGNRNWQNFGPCPGSQLDTCVFPSDLWHDKALNDMTWQTNRKACGWALINTLHWIIESYLYVMASYKWMMSFYKSPVLRTIDLWCWWILADCRQEKNQQLDILAIFYERQKFCSFMKGKWYINWWQFELKSSQSFIRGKSSPLYRIPSISSQYFHHILSPRASHKRACNNAFLMMTTKGWWPMTRPTVSQARVLLSKKPNAGSIFLCFSCLSCIPISSNASSSDVFTISSKISSSTLSL